MRKVNFTLKPLFSKLANYLLKLILIVQEEQFSNFKIGCASVATQISTFSMRAYLAGGLLSEFSLPKICAAIRFLLPSLDSTYPSATVDELQDE